MHQRDLAAIAVHEPDTIHFVPGTFMAEHQQIRIGGGKLEMVEPVGGSMNDLGLASAGVDGEQRHRQVRGQALFHHLAFRLWLIELLWLVGLRAVSRLPVVCAFAFDIGSREKRFVGIDRSN